jgi:aerobic carbon-monoxide dehydrogenase small subunit
MSEMTNRHRRTIRFTLNGRKVTAEIAVHENLVEMLQREFSLYGARESCGQGLCGCCTVLVNGMAVSGCLYLAALADGTEILTIEGLAQGGQLDPIQRAFISNGAFQCGFCTPGMILTSKELLETNPNPSEEQIRHHLSGNLCRCASYPDIVRAVKEAAAPGTVKTSST